MAATNILSNNNSSNDVNLSSCTVKVEKYKSELDSLVQLHKQAEKASKMASIKLDVLTNHFKDREKELTS